MGSETRAIFIAIHTLTQAAIIHLYQRFAPDDPVAYDKCSHAARACGAIITHITEPDFDFLDPILGVCGPPFLLCESAADFFFCSLALLDIGCGDLDA
jgi:hypothetical protein